MTDLREHDPAFSGTLAPEPRLSTSAALRRHWILALLPILLFAGLGVGAAFARTPQYTAETRLAVGRVDASTPGALAGFTSTSQSLAETYSRTVTADVVVADAASRLGVEPGDVRGNVTAAPIPETPVFRVSGVASSEDGAVRLANVASDSLVKAITAQQRSSPDSDDLLEDFGGASRDLAEARANARRERREAGDELTSGERRAVATANAEVARAQLRADTLSEAYQNSLQSAGSSGVINVIQHARSATSDRGPTVQLLGFIGLVAGGAIGLGLALLAGARDVARRRA